MKFLKLNLLLIISVSSLLILSCEKDMDTFDDPDEFVPLVISSEIDAQMDFFDNQGPHEHNFSSKINTGFIEGYESATKFTYSTRNLNLTSGSWRFGNAKIGQNSRDRKFGRKAARLRNTGYIIMNFNMDNGVKILRVRHAKYGNDGNSSWRLVASYDNGQSWSFVGNTVNTTSTTLNTVSFELNETRSVRYGISKRSGGSSRINIDNFEILTETTGDGGGTGGDGNGGGGTGGDGDGGGDTGGDGDGDNGGTGRDSNLTFGNPSNAATSPNNYFLRREEYSLSYNSSNGTPNWVSWHLNSAWTGSRGRCNCFMQDTSLPDGIFSPTENDYSGSGFQRGHMCPSADRDLTDQENANTYFMTNMAPQTIGNNLGPWADFERYLRSLTRSGSEIHIIAGPAGTGGTGTRGFRERIAGGRINVPDSFWKVALILPNGANDISRVTTSTRVIAVNMPNDQGVSSNWRNFVTTVDAIEALTGFDFYENVPDAIESVIEARLNN